MLSLFRNFYWWKGDFPWRCHRVSSLILFRAIKQMLYLLLFIRDEEDGILLAKEAVMENIKIEEAVKQWKAAKRQREEDGEEQPEDADDEDVQDVQVRFTTFAREMTAAKCIPTGIVLDKWTSFSSVLLGFGHNTVDPRVYTQ